jgi:hypothetical protein
MSEHRYPAEGLRQALAAAARMRAEDADPHGVARWLQHCQRRCEGLEALLRITDRYLRFGMPEHELSEMRLLVSRLREAERSPERASEVDDTLPL